MNVFLDIWGRYAHVVCIQFVYTRSVCCGRQLVHCEEPDMKPEALLPLKPDLFQILLTLLDGENHGYAIMQEIAHRTGGEVRLLPGALYRHLQRLLETGLTRELERRRVTDSSDERRRYYAITDFGRQVAEAEANRLVELVRFAKLRNLLQSEN